MSDPTHFGKYIVSGAIGEGSMARVFRAHDPHLERDVAIKTLKEHLLRDDDNAEELIRRFGREARIVAKLKHENFVAVYEYVDQWDPPFIAMELVEGKTLAELLRENYRFKPEEAVNIIKQVLAALAYAHNQGVIHRDVKPQNIFLLPDHRIKITDFGIAQIQASTLTQVGSVMGTAAYMAPEQFRGEKVDGRCDLWSVGIILFELLSGKRPFRGGAETVRQKVLSDDPPFDLSEPYRRIPDEFEPVIRKALMKPPDQRFQDAAEFAQALEDAIQQYRDGTQLKPPPKTETTGTNTIVQAPSALQGRRGLMFAVGFIAVPALVAAMVYVVHETAPDERWIEERVHQVKCAVIEHEVQGKDVVLSGVGGQISLIDTLKSDLAKKTRGSVRGEITMTDPRFCGVLDLVSGLRREGKLAQPGIELHSDHALLAEGKALDVQLNAPAYPSYLTLDFLSSSGQVLHVFPDRELGAVKLAAEEKKSLHQLAGDAVTYEVACPCGQEMLLAISTAAPLPPRGEEEESAELYLEELKGALNAMPKTSPVSIHVMPLTTVAR